ncbi:MAG: dipeptidase [Ferrimicrobium sp.]
MNEIKGNPGHGPWVDLHAHPGRCFLAGIDLDDPLGILLSTASWDASVAEIIHAGMAAVAFATVADLRVLGFSEDGELREVRSFDKGEAYTDHRRQLEGLRELAKLNRLPIVHSADDIIAAHEAGVAALFLTCEGADFVEDRLERLLESHTAGVRSITIMHYRRNHFGDLQTEESIHGGLTGAGRELVHEMNRVGLLIDVAHASFATTMGVLEESSAPVVLSHSHLEGKGRDHPRLIRREHAVAVAAQGGVVGAWPAGVSSETFEDFVDEIVRLVDAIGVEHVAIGTDMDANYRPVMNQYAQFGSIGQSLAKRGLSAAELDQVLGDNAVSLIRKVCG